MAMAACCRHPAAVETLWAAVGGVDDLRGACASDLRRAGAVLCALLHFPSVATSTEFCPVARACLCPYVSPARPACTLI